MWGEEGWAFDEELDVDTERMEWGERGWGKGHILMETGKWKLSSSSEDEEDKRGHNNDFFLLKVHPSLEGWCFLDWSVLSSLVSVHPFQDHNIRGTLIDLIPWVWEHSIYYLLTSVSLQCRILISSCKKTLSQSPSECLPDVPVRVSLPLVRLQGIYGILQCHRVVVQSEAFYDPYRHACLPVKWILVMDAMDRRQQEADH